MRVCVCVPACLRACLCMGEGGMAVGVDGAKG